MVASALGDHGYRLWTDWTSKLSLGRRWAVHKDDTTETGLDTWLRSGAIRSDILVGIIPERHFLSAFHNFREGDDTVPFVELMVRDLHPSKLYRDTGTSFYFFQHPRRLWQNEWYYWALGFRIAKDRLETWQMWEMRVARAMGTPLLISVLGEATSLAPTIEHLIAVGMNQLDVNPRWFDRVSFKTLTLIRKPHLLSDVRANLIPALEALTLQEQTQRSRSLRRRYHVARILSPVAVALLPLALLLLLVVFLACDLGLLFWGAIKWVWARFQK